MAGRIPDSRIPKGMCRCPVCDGERIVALDPHELKYSWNKGKTHRACQNCGGQTMFGVAQGYTTLNKTTGEPCKHTFRKTKKGNCYYEYECTDCGTSYTIDSGG